MGWFWRVLSHFLSLFPLTRKILLFKMKLLPNIVQGPESNKQRRTAGRIAQIVRLLPLP